MGRLPRSLSRCVEGGPVRSQAPMIDTHCHILPGIDDGPRDLAEALEMARIAVADGIQTIVATPHLDCERDALSPDFLRDQVARFNAALTEAQIPLTVLPGAEIRIGADLLERAKAGSLMTLADRGTHLLLELPFNSYPSYVPQLFFGLQLLGLAPILAHPERTALFRTHPEVIQGLVDRGALIQVNADSLTRWRDRTVRALAFDLLKHGAVHLLASDAHDTRHRPPQLSRARRALRRHGGDEVFARLTQTTPSRLLSAQPARRPEPKA